MCQKVQLAHVQAKTIALDDQGCDGGCCFIGQFWLLGSQLWLLKKAIFVGVEAVYKSSLLLPNAVLKMYNVLYLVVQSML